MRIVSLLFSLAFFCASAFGSVTVTVNGSNHTIPQTNEKGWGTNVTAWIQAISQYTLQPSGGTFTLTAEVDTGATYGFKVPYIKGQTATPATAGVVRLAKTDVIDWRNNGGGGNLPLGINGSDQLTFNSVAIPTATTGSFQDSTFNIYDDGDNTKKIAFQASGITAGNTRTVTVPDSNVDLGHIVNANIDAAAAIAYSKLNLGTSIVNADINGSAAIVDTKLATISTASKVSNSATTAASANTASAIVARDGSGNFIAGTITAALTGTASGNTTYSANNHGVVLSGAANAMTVIAPDSSATKVLKSGGSSADPTWLAYDNANTVSTLVFRDGSGNFTAGTVTAALTGTASGNLTYSANSHGVLLSGAANTVTVIAPDASLTKVLTSNGASADPSWQAVPATPGTGVFAYNYLINSGFDYWQMGTSATVTATGGGTPTATYLYQADQWYVNNILGGGSVEGIITYSQLAAVTNGSGFGAKVLITTAPTGTGIQNGAELWQTLSNKASKSLYGQSASFTVLVKAFGNVNQIGCQFYYASSEAKATVAIGSEQTATVNTSTFSACTISNQALGTSQTLAGTIGVRIRPTGVSSGNLYDLNNGYVVEQAMLNIGATAGTFARQFQDPVAELSAAQYFYEKSYDLTDAPGTSTGNSSMRTIASGTNLEWTIIPKSIKRVTGTVTTYSTTGASGKIRGLTGAVDVSTSISTQGTRSATVNATVADQQVYGMHWTWNAQL